jgi:hypothetical protein
MKDYSNKIGLKTQIFEDRVKKVVGGSNYSLSLENSCWDLRLLLAFSH